MEEQNVKVQEATVLYKEAVHQTELNALVKLHAKWVTLNQTALEQLHTQSIQVETSSLESKTLKKTKTGKYTKAKESVHRVYGKHCSFGIYTSSFFQICFMVFITFSSILKHPNKSFF